MVKSTWRLLELDVESYAEASMSLSPAIGKACEEGKAPETLAMYTHQKPSIVMGRQNDPEVDVNYDYCQKNGIVVKRVPTPGTIFGHPGYIMNVLYIHKDRVPDVIPEVFALLNTQCASAFEKKWGLNARHRPINDLEVQTKGVWKKIGPFSISFFGSFICCRMGLTISPIPYETVEMAMPGPPEKFADKEAKSVSQRVGSMKEALGRDVEFSEVKEVVKGAFTELFNTDFAPGELSDIEKKYETELLGLYDNDDWFWANSVKRRFADIPSNASLHELTKKIAQGPLVRARVLKSEGKLLDCSLTGWYHGLRPLDALEKIESNLKEVPLSSEDILSQIEKAYKDGNIEIDQCTPDHLEKIIREASEKPPLSI